MDNTGASYINKDSPFKTPAFINIKDIPDVPMDLLSVQLLRSLQVNITLTVCKEWAVHT